MKKIIIGIIVFVVFLSLCACGQDNYNNDAATLTYTRISASEARNMMAELDEFVLLDVRTTQEFEQGHIEGAILISEDVLKVRAGDELLDKDAIIFVYCRSGRRSVSAARTLVDLGYTNVYDFGGIESWPYEVVR